MLVLAALAGCENDVPTAVGEAGFPAGQRPTTIDAVLPGAEFVRAATTFSGFADVRTLPYLLAANQFDGALTAHALIRYTGYPASATFGAGRLVGTVDTAATVPRAPITLQLFSLVQPFDSATVSWRFAVDRPGLQVPWRTPGGTVGRLLAEAQFVPGDTVRRDSIVFSIDSLTVQRLAEGEIAGLLVRSSEVNSRVELSGLSLESVARRAGRPDSVFTLTRGTQTFIFTPEVPTLPGVLRTGGPAAARTVLRLGLDRRVSTCRPPATAPGCREVPLREVTLDRVSLLLDPVPVPLGFRPVRRAVLQVRRVLEPELGRLAPLGEVLAEDTVPAAAFAAPGSAPVAIELTGAVRELIAAEAAEVTLALIGNPNNADFGLLWFDRPPRLRLLYTVPPTLRLP